MQEVAIGQILCGVCDKLHQRKIRKTNGYDFSAKDMSRVIKFFLKEKAAQSVSYEALIQLDGTVYNGFITIWRDGTLNVNLVHDEYWQEMR